MTIDNNTIMGIDFIFMTGKVGRTETRTARHSEEFRGTTLIVINGELSSDFFHAIAGDICAAIERDITDNGRAEAPEIIEAFGRIVIEVSTTHSEFAVWRAIVERDDMVVRTAELFTVFPATEETKTSTMMIAQAFEELLIFRKIEGATWREVLGIIREG